MAKKGEFIAAVVVLLLFYVLIVVIGAVAAWFYKRKYGKRGSHDLNSTTTSGMDLQIVAGRQLGPVVGIFTMTATLVGGGFLNGTAESVAKDGLIWTLAPFGICIGLVLGGIFFAGRMRAERYTTMLDPFEKNYGSFVTGLLFLSCLFGDMLWSGAILAALGTSLSVILDLNIFVSVIVSSSISVLYTLIGQMVSVAYTDIAELIFLTLGMVLVVPFAMIHEAVPSILSSETRWLGSLDSTVAPLWVDLAITMTLGSIPWQSYFQRVLSVRSSSDAKIFSFVAGFGALVLAIPPVLIGFIGANADWNSTGLNETVYSDKSLTLPLVIQQFTPAPVAILGLGAIAAAVMSSTDSAILGSSSMFTHNVYNKLRPKASQLELSLVLKICILLVGAGSTVIALATPSLTIYGLFILAADVVFVTILPQLICVLYFRTISNGYGALIGYAVGLVLRFGAGEPLLAGMNAILHYPLYSPETGQLFPFRTFSMLCSLVTTLVISLCAKIVLKRLHPSFDIINNIHSKNKNHGCDNEDQPNNLDGDANNEVTLSHKEEHHDLVTTTF